MGSSPGFGSNPDNLPGLVEAPPLASVPCSPEGPTNRTGRVLWEHRPTALPPPGCALFGLAFAVAPELLFLNRAA